MRKYLKYLIFAILCMNSYGVECQIINGTYSGNDGDITIEGNKLTYIDGSNYVISNIACRFISEPPIIDVYAGFDLDLITENNDNSIATPPFKPQQCSYLDRNEYSACYDDSPVYPTRSPLIDIRINGNKYYIH